MKCFCAIFSQFPSLPPTIDPTLATDALRTQRGRLLNLLRHCLLGIADSLFSERIIPREVHEKAGKQLLDSTERGVALLDCVESRIEIVPSDFTKVVHILEAEPFLESLAKDLIQSYCKCMYIASLGVDSLSKSN